MFHRVFSSLSHVVFCLLGFPSNVWKGKNYVNLILTRQTCGAFLGRSLLRCWPFQQIKKLSQKRIVICNFGLNRNCRTFIGCPTGKSLTKKKGLERKSRLSNQSEKALPVCLYLSVSGLWIVSSFLGVHSSVLYIDEPNRRHVFLGEVPY